MLALSTLNKIQDGAPASSFATATCLFPKRYRVRMSETGDYQDIVCDCGTCERCTDARREDWAARMFLHSLSYEYCYFFTLTYGSYNLLPFIRHPFQNDWINTLPSYDSFNSLGHNAWTPSLLCQSHLTKFLKRLRVLLNVPISYVACGEYGDDYGRPHFHVILWSHSQVTREQVENAWSLECKRTSNKLVVRPWRSDEAKTKENGYFRFKIGRVDFNDLWLNGSLNYDGKHPGLNTIKDPNKNAMYNFTYVAKYLGKSAPSQYYHKLPFLVQNRIQGAFNLLTKSYDELSNLYTRPEMPEDIEELFASGKMEYHHQIYNELQKPVHYDYQNYKDVDFTDFQKIVSPFFCCSRRPSIGKDYYLQHRTRFLQKEYGLPSFMGKPVAFPAYFTRLIQQDKYPIRLRKITQKGLSLTKDLLPRLEHYLTELRADSRYWYTLRGLGKDANGFKFHLCGLAWYEDTSALPKDYSPYALRRGSLDSIDLLDSAGSVIHYYYRPQEEVFEGWIYDPSSRYVYDEFGMRSFDYRLVDVQDRISFCDMVLDLIDSSYNDYQLKIDNMQKRVDLYQTIQEDPETENVKSTFLQLRKKMQTMYNIKKQKINL